MSLVPSFQLHYFLVFGSIGPVSLKEQYPRILFDSIGLLVPGAVVRAVLVHADRCEPVSMCAHEQCQWSNCSSIASNTNSITKSDRFAFNVCSMHNWKFTCKNESLLFVDRTETWSESSAIFVFFVLRLGKQHKPLYKYTCND